VVVDLGEADVLVRQQTQLVDSGLDAGRARRDGFQKFAQLPLIDSDASERGCAWIIALGRAGSAV